MKKAGSKKQQLIDQKNKEHSKKYIKTAKTPKQTEKNQKPYTTPLPGAPVGHNVAWNSNLNSGRVNET